MLNIDSLDSGIVIDHIKAGSSMEIYRYLRLDQRQGGTDPRGCLFRCYG